MANTKKRGNGDGSIYYSEQKKKYVGQVTTGKEDGKYKRQTVYGKTKKEVKDKIAKLQNELMYGIYCKPNEITIPELIESLIEEDKALNLIGDTAYLRKMDSQKRIKKSCLCNVTLQKATEAQIKKYLYSITSYSNSVIGKDYALLKRCFREGVKKGIVSKNIIEDLPKPKSEQPKVKVRALTLEEQKRLLSVLTDKVLYSDQMKLMLFTGMRMGEINALDFNDVSLPFRTINIRRTVTKNKKDESILGTVTKTYAGIRKIPITTHAEAILRSCLSDYIPNDKKLLFYDYKANKVITTNQVNHEFQRLIKKEKIIDNTVPGKVSLHSLRHTYATRAIESGMPVKVLSALLGHTDVSITLNTYCDAFADYQDKNIDQLEKYLEEQKISV